MFWFHEKKVCENCGQEFYAHIDDAYKWKYCLQCRTPHARNHRRYLRQRSHLTQRAADVTTCAEIGWHEWRNGVCLRCGEREYNPSRG
jgi:ribosomal protein L32